MNDCVHWFRIADLPLLIFIRLR